MLTVDVVLACGTPFARRRHLAHGARCRTCWPDTGLPPLPDACHSDSDIGTPGSASQLRQLILDQFGPGQAAA